MLCLCVGQCGSQLGWSVVSRQQQSVSGITAEAMVMVDAEAKVVKPLIMSQKRLFQSHRILQTPSPSPSPSLYRPRKTRRQPQTVLRKSAIAVHVLKSSRQPPTTSQTKPGTHRYHTLGMGMEMEMEIEVIMSHRDDTFGRHCLGSM